MIGTEPFVCQRRSECTMLVNKVTPTKAGYSGLWKVDRHQTVIFVIVFWGHRGQSSHFRFPWGKRKVMWEVLKPLCVCLCRRWGWFRSPGVRPGPAYSSGPALTPPHLLLTVVHTVLMMSFGQQPHHLGIQKVVLPQGLRRMFFLVWMQCVASDPATWHLGLL